jgi:GntR family transcriptional regulator/MocR family aminotransferase
VDVHVTLVGRRDLSGQIYRHLRAAIVDGRLRPGDALPPTRELAARLAVSRSTITTAYERLFSEGFVSGHVGAGTFVCELAARAAPKPRAPSRPGLRARAVWESVEMMPEEPARKLAYDFRVGVPDARLFPYATWRRLVTAELRSPGQRVAAYGDPSGDAGLREAIARHVGVSRAVQASADDVIVTSGAQQALDLIGRVLIDPGTCVAVEDPGYPMARSLFQSLGARVVPVPVDAEGLQVDALPDAAKLVYVTPSHQFPLGMPMSLPRRMALLAWAERRQAAVIEDDYDSEFRFGGRPLEPLQCLDRSGLVLYVGSFSKVLLPALRLGYLVAPPTLYPALRTAKQVTDWHAPTAAQAALARFIDDGLLARHVRAARREYQARRERLERALARDLAGWLELVPAVAGLHVSALFRDPAIDAGAVVRAAHDAGVAVTPLSHFAMAPAGRAGLVLGYGAITHGRIDEGVRRLAACVETVGRITAATPPGRASRSRASASRTGRKPRR